MGYIGGPYSWFDWACVFSNYHVEHHDFPEIPCTKLPELRRIACEFYDETSPDYQATTSWVEAVRGAFSSPQFYGCMGPDHQGRPDALNDRGSKVISPEKIEVGKG